MSVIRIVGNKPLRVTFDEGEMQSVLQEMAEEVRSEAISEVNSGGRSGGVRSDGKRASSKGEAPYTDTGELISSIRVEGTKVGSTAYHGKIHETTDRPFIEPAIEEVSGSRLSEMVNPIGGK